MFFGATDSYAEMGADAVGPLIWTDRSLVNPFFTRTYIGPTSYIHSTRHPTPIPIENPESTVQALTKSSTSELSYILLEQARGRFF